MGHHVIMDMKYFIITILFLSSILIRAQHNWQRTNPGGGGAFNTVKVGPTGIVFVGSDLSGVYMSHDDGSTWEVIGSSRGMDVTHISGLGFDPVNEDIMYIGTEDGIFRSQDQGLNFQKVLNTGYITDISFSESNTNIGYTASQPDYETLDCEILKTTNQGLSWTTVSVNLPTNIHVLKIVVHPTDPNTVYVHTGAGRWSCGEASIYKSINGGVSWNQLGATYGEILDMAIDPQNPETLYLTTMNAGCNEEYYWTDLAGDLYQSTNGGSSWTQVTNKTGVIWLDPSNSNKIRIIDPRENYPWISTAGTWTSINGGSSWIHNGNIDNWETGYQEDLYYSYGTSFNGVSKTLSHHPNDPDKMYWVNSQFVYGTNDGGTVFTDKHTNEVATDWWQSRGIDNVNMLDIAVCEANPDKVYIGYFDIGFWRTEDGGAGWQQANHNDYTPDWEGHGGNVSSICADPVRENVVWASMSDGQNGGQIGPYIIPNYLIKNTNSGHRNNWVESDAGLELFEVMGISLAPSSPVNNRTLLCTSHGDVYKSTDDGTTWSISLENGGLRFTYFDYFDANLMYAGGEDGLWKSTDGGANWTVINYAEISGTSSFWGWGFEGVFDIKTDPNQTGIVYVTVFGDGKGLYRSDNEGQTWTKLITDDYMRCVAISPNNSQIVYATSSEALEAGGSPISSGVWFSNDGGASFENVTEDMSWPFAVPVEIAGDYVFVGSPGTGIQKSLILQGGVELELKVFLEGPYDETTQLMNDDLRQNGELPLSEPFTTLGFNHVGSGGGEIMESMVLTTTGNNAIVDWVFVELRNSTNVILATQSALLQRDGDVVHLDGLSPISMNGFGAGEVYVVLRHRNHLGVKALNLITTTSTITFDFTNPSNLVFGSQPMANIGSVRAMFSGDANGDGQINAVDKNNFWRVENGEPYLYLNSKADFNLDGVVNPVDKNSYWRVNNSVIEEIE